MKKIYCFLVAVCLIGGNWIYGQVSVTTDGTSAHPSSMVEIKSTEKGFLPPRMTTPQRDAIDSPAEGLVIFNTTIPCLQFFDGVYWRCADGSNVELSFTCGISSVTDIDGNVYNTVLIGNQCWMKENLNTGTIIDGNQDQTSNGIIEKYCYDNNLANCSSYGGLYQWDEMMGYSTTPGVQGICPTGWHIPTDDEWKILEGMADSQYGVGDPIWNNYGWRGTDAGCNLKSTNGWYGSLGTDLYGFRALPCGIRLINGMILYLSHDGYWWSSSEDLSLMGAYRRWLSYFYCTSSRSHNDKKDGLSVRCLKD